MRGDNEVEKSDSSLPQCVQCKICYHLRRLQRIGGSDGELVVRTQRILGSWNCTGGVELPVDWNYREDCSTLLAHPVNSGFILLWQSRACNHDVRDEHHGAPDQRYAGIAGELLRSHFGELRDELHHELYHPSRLYAARELQGGTEMIPRRIYKERRGTNTQRK